jgi:hypothetical protein
MNSKAQQELAVVTSLRQVIDVSRQDVSVGPWHALAYPARRMHYNQKTPTQISI